MIARLELAAVKTRSMVNIWRTIARVMLPSAIAITPAMQTIDSAPAASVATYSASQVCGSIVGGGLGQRADDHERDADRQRELREVEEELDRRQPPERVRRAGAEQRADQEAVTACKREPEHEREVGQRERMRAAAEVEVDDARFPHRPRDGDRPPRQMRLGERGLVVQRGDEERPREHGERRAVEHDGAASFHCPNNHRHDSIIRPDRRGFPQGFWSARRHAREKSAKGCERARSMARTMQRTLIAAVVALFGVFAGPAQAAPPRATHIVQVREGVSLAEGQRGRPRRRRPRHGHAAPDRRARRPRRLRPSAWRPIRGSRRSAPTRGSARRATASTRPSSRPPTRRRCWPRRPGTPRPAPASASRSSTRASTAASSTSPTPRAPRAS